jgi:SAM-dependent methyltransferase
LPIFGSLLIIPKMGVRLARKKPKQFLLGLIYRLQKLLPLNKRAKLKLFLDLEWIFDRLAHEFSFKVIPTKDHPVRQRSLEFVIKNIEASSTVLDLGCNFGFLSCEVSKTAKEVIGIDTDASAINKARELYKKDNLGFVVGEARAFLSSTSKKFDVLLLSHVLEHIDEPKDFILSFKDSFKKIYIEVPDFNKNYLNEYRKEIGCELIYTDDDHVSEFDRDELLRLLNECGLEVEIADFRYGVMKVWCKVK